jgi:hypothetical protein
MKHKVPFVLNCPRCKGYCEIITDKQGYHMMDIRHADVGDIVACTVCDCVGEIKLWLWQKYLSWPQPDDACWNCRLKLAILERVQGVKTVDIIVEGQDNE